MRDHAFIGHSILRQPRSSRVDAIVRFGLAIAIAAGIWACRHSESDSSAPAKVAGRWQAGNFQPGRPASAMRDGSWRYGAARLRRFVPDAADGSAGHYHDRTKRYLCAEPLRHRWLLKTQSARIHWWFRTHGDSLPSWRCRQAQRSRSPEANPEPAPRCCWKGLPCAIKSSCWSAAELVVPALAVGIGYFGSCSRAGGPNGATA